MKFYFGNQETPKILTKLGTDVTNRKTNAVGKSDEKACNWVFLSAMIHLTSVPNNWAPMRSSISSAIIMKNVMSSPTEFECHAGTVIAGVALRGEFVKIAE